MVWAAVNHGGLFGVALDPVVPTTLKSTSRAGAETTLTIDSFTSHVYKLRCADALVGGSGFVAADGT